MTSDAKIGLLLGLIFIFVIAFVINGLPNLRPQTTKGEAVPTNMMPTTDENLGVADKAQKAQETIGWSDLLDKQTEPPADQPVATKSAEPTTPKAEQPVAADNSKEGIRSIVPMPSASGIEKLTKGLEDIVQALAPASGPAAAQDKTTEPAPSVEVAESQPKLERPQTTETAETAKPAASAPAGALKTYVVVDGDTLASVAKKVYGPEEGNRIVNNLRIFEANRNILKSPDDIAIGQELVIPPPAKPKAEKPDTVLPKTLFEKVEAIGKRRVPNPDKTERGKQPPAEKPAATKKQPAKPPTNERWYVVQDGDNLWRIASTQLGSGARYEEITKLNADILKGDIKLNGGMRLRLPSQ